jgi:hypothetical protein
MAVAKYHRQSISVLRRCTMRRLRVRLFLAVTGIGLLAVGLAASAPFMMP